MVFVGQTDRVTLKFTFAAMLQYYLSHVMIREKQMVQIPPQNVQFVIERKVQT